MYGRRLRLNRKTTRRHPTTTPIPRSAGQEEIAIILDDYASGKLARVPRSAFCVDSPLATSQRYDDIIAKILRWRRYATEWRAEKNSEWRDEATSHVDAATTCENLQETKEMLKKASISLKKMNLVEEHFDMVFVYDIGEITMLSKNYIAEFTTMYPEIDSYSLFKFAEKVLNSVHLTRKELAEKVVISTFYPPDDDIEYWRRVAPKYQDLQELYDEIPKKGDPDISQELCNKCGMGDEVKNLRKTAAQLQKRVHQRWRRVRKCLELVHQKSRVSPGKYANVVLCEEAVGLGACEILVSGQSSYIPIENVYSTATLDREAVFDKLEERFGETCVFVYVSSQKTIGVSKTGMVRHWPVEAADSIKKLYKAQKNHFFK